MNKRKQRWIKGICMMLLLGLATGIGAVAQQPDIATVQAASSRRKLTDLIAEYKGETLMVGETIAKRDIEVIGIYDDGSEAVIRSFSLSTSKVAKDGENVIRITYNGLKTEVTVFGKKVESIEAEYVGEDVTVGQSVKKKDIRVTVYFTDGSMEEEITNFTIKSDVVRKEGENVLRVSYGGKNADIFVYGIPPLAVEEIDAWYEGEGVIVGNAPDKSLLHAIAYYNDGTEKEITNYTLLPDTVTKVGTNRITLIYDSEKVVFEVEGLPKEVLAITAKYNGPALEIGDKVNKKYVTVTATFNDGSKGPITDFTIPSPKIYEIGLNEIWIECGDAEPVSILVRGVKAEYVDYSNAVSTEIKKETTVFEMDFAVPYPYDSEDLKTVQLKSNEIGYAMKRAIGNSEYIAFKIVMSDELELDLPLTVKVTLPEAWDAESFAVYYTTNGKTVAAKMNGEFLDDETYEFKIFQHGMYAFVNTKEEMKEEPKEEPELKDPTQEKEDTESEEKVIPAQTVTLQDIKDGKLTLKVGQQYQLKVNIKPSNATDQTVYYTTTRKADVTVSETGLLTGIKEGVALITVWVGEDRALSTKVLVYVK